MSPTHSRAGGIMPRYHAATGGSGSAAAYETAVLADSPWGFWKLRETSGTTLADASGNSRTMGIAGGPTLAQVGPDGTVGDAIAWPADTLNNIANTSPAAFASSAATLEVWIKLTATPTALTGAFGCAVNNGNTTYDKDVFVDTAGKVNFYCFTGATTTITASSALTLNTWHHVVASVGAAGMKLRIDKATVATNAATSSYTGAQEVILHGGGTSYATHSGSALTTGPCAIWASQLTDAQTDAHAVAFGH